METDITLCHYSCFVDGVGREMAQAQNAKLAGRMTTIAEGNGAEFLPSPNFNRPRRNRISCFMA